VYIIRLDFFEINQRIKSKTLRTRAECTCLRKFSGKENDNQTLSISFSEEFDIKMDKNRYLIAPLDFEPRTKTLTLVTEPSNMFGLKI
jgi:hypothetical protein